MGTATGDLFRRYWRHHLPRRVADLEQKLVPIEPEEIDLLRADRVVAIIHERTGLAPSEYSGMDAGGKVAWLEKALADPEAKTGGRRQPDGDEDHEDLLEKIDDILSPNQTKIFRALWTRKSYSADYDHLAQVPGAFRGRPSDETITKALKRIRTKLDEALLGVTLTISSAKRRAKVDTFRDK